MLLARAFWCSAGAAGGVAERTARVIQQALAAAGIMNAGSLFLKWGQQKRPQLALAELPYQPTEPEILVVRLVLVLLYLRMGAGVAETLQPPTVLAGAN
jgi:hypothetical protein